MNRISELIYTFRRNVSRFAWFALAIFLMSSVLVTTLVAIQIVDSLKERFLRQFQLEVYLHASATGPERDSVLAALKRNVPPGTSFQYISPGEARERFMQEFGPDLLNLLGENPLPPSYIVTLPKALATPSRMRQIQKFASDLPPVNEAVFEGELAGWVENSFNDTIPYIIGIGVGLALVFIVIGVFIVRSAVTGSATMANVLSLLGASRGYFRRPYYQLAAIIGFITGALAVAWGWLTMFWLAQRNSPIATTIPLSVFLIPLIALLIGWSTGWLAARGSGKIIKQPEQ